MFLNLQVCHLRLIPLWPKKILLIISILLNLLRYVLWTRKWSKLINVLCELEIMRILPLLDGIFYKCQFDQVVTFLLIFLPTGYVSY